MTDGRDPLERELESVRPPELPPALRARIGRAIEAGPPGRGRFGRPALAAGAGLAACVAAAAWFSGRPAVPPGPAVVTVPPRPPPTPPGRQPPVTLAAYTRAAGASAAEIDSLLDADAARPLGPGPRAFARSMDEWTE